MKICSKCGIAKDVELFAKRSKSADGRSTWCKECFKSYDRERYKTVDKERKARNATTRRVGVKNWIWDFLSSHPCIDCGESDPVVLEFDHQGDKLYDVANMLHWHGLDSVKAEVAKCEVRCANCHRRRTAIQFGTWKTNR